MVEAGQRYEGDVIVVESAGWRDREGKSKAEENNCTKNPTAVALYGSAVFTFLQTANGPNDISTNAQDRVPAIVSARW